eukprot:CAMPEP_0113876238 /NCGR_PEP_ID=MMETSP0780_2-20120614/5379_1 /TAXON_ID=652834 /ORGANISM="Palpitomonas bilix" /LENGTH=183 /DNA_ID=CAMNT_0000862301 /DNA_START=174 /DNA_END=721 /DNA_ORIENTATION=+ /assembly_acc=CAM_ASM_000599
MNALSTVSVGRARLKRTASVSALLSGFSMVAMVEVDIKQGTDSTLVAVFAGVTATTIVLHLLALATSIFLLPVLDVISSHATSRISPSRRVSYPESYDRWITFAWVGSTVVGMALFVIDLAVLSWVKFSSYYSSAAVVATLVSVIAVCCLVAISILLARNEAKLKFDLAQLALASMQSGGEEG